MARQLRVEFEGAVYGVTSRGNARQPIFLDDLDRSWFLAGLLQVVERYECVCHTYCLMGNHYHAVIETPRANLSLALRQLNGTYAARFNRRHGRVGHVFQGRFHSVLVEKERHALELARYTVLNPVRAGLCQDAAEWAWSSYRALAGMEPPPPLLSVAWLLGQFSGDRARAHQRFRKFVREDDGRNPLSAARGEIYLGDRHFVERNHPAAPLSREHPEAQRRPLRSSLRAILLTGSDAEIEAAVRVHGYRLAEVAAYLGVHPSTVTRRVAEIERRRRPGPAA